MTWTVKPSYFMTTRRMDGVGADLTTERTQTVAALTWRPAE